MKKLLLILLFIPEIIQSQIVINSSFTSLTTVTTNAAAFGHSGMTMTAGRLYLFIAIVTGGDNAGTFITASTTWNDIISIGDVTRRIRIARCMPTTTVTGEFVNLNFDILGESVTGYSTAIFEITGVDQTGSNGAGAIVQSNNNSGSPSADPSITLSAISSPRNAVVAFFSNDANTFGGTPESGWTEIHDGGYDTPTSGAYYMQRLKTTDNTPTVTASSSTWIGVAIELAAAGRRTSVTSNNK